MRCKYWVLVGNALLLRLARSNKKSSFPRGFQSRGMRIFASNHNNFIISFSELVCVFPCQAALISLSNSQLDLGRSSHPLSDDRKDCKQKNWGLSALHQLFVSIGFTNLLPSRCLTSASVGVTVGLLKEFAEEPACMLKHLKELQTA